MSEKVYQEKRQFVRIPIETQVSFTLDENDDVQYNGISQNLSAGGLYMTTGQVAKLGDYIKIVLNATEKHDTPLIAEGTIVRCRFDRKDNDLYHVSVQFSETHESWVQIITAN